MLDGATRSSDAQGDNAVISENAVLGWLRSSVVFRGLNPDDLRRFLPGLQVVKFKAGDLVIAENTVSSSLFVVTDGEFLGRWNVAGDGPGDANRSRFVRGDCFGEYSLIDRSPASATVSAVAPSQALQIVRHTFDAALQSDYRIAKTVYFNLLLLLTARLRAANLT